MFYSLTTDPRVLGVLQMQFSDDEANPKEPSTIRRSHSNFCHKVMDTGGEAKPEEEIDVKNETVSESLGDNDSK